MRTLLLMACTSNGADSAPTPAATVPDTGLDLSAPEWIEDDAVAGWEASQVQGALEANAQNGFASAEQIRGTFLDFVAQGDEFCPPGGVNFGASHCQTASGYAFSGISIYNESSIQQEGKTVRQWTHVGDYALTRPDGSQFLSGGGLVSQAEIGSEKAHVNLNLRGSWWDQGSNIGWFQDGVSWLVLGEGERDAEGAWLELEGGITTGRPLFFEGTRFSTDDSCPVEGALRVQGDDGYWYRWEAACDGCGPVSFQDGTELGGICPDLGNWRAAAMTLVPELKQNGPDDGPDEPEEEP